MKRHNCPATTAHPATTKATHDPGTNRRAKHRATSAQTRSDFCGCDGPNENSGFINHACSCGCRHQARTSELSNAGRLESRTGCAFVNGADPTVNNLLTRHAANIAAGVLERLRQAMGLRADGMSVNLCGQLFGYKHVFSKHRLPLLCNGLHQSLFNVKFTLNFHQTVVFASQRKTGQVLRQALNTQKGQNQLWSIGQCGHNNPIRGKYGKVRVLQRAPEKHYQQRDKRPPTTGGGPSGGDPLVCAPQTLAGQAGAGYNRYRWSACFAMRRRLCALPDSARAVWRHFLNSSRPLCCRFDSCTGSVCLGLGQFWPIFLPVSRAQLLQRHLAISQAHNRFALRCGHRSTLGLPLMYCGRGDA